MASEAFVCGSRRRIPADPVVSLRCVTGLNSHFLLFSVSVSPNPIKFFAKIEWVEGGSFTPQRLVVARASAITHTRLHRSSSFGKLLRRIRVE